MRHEQGSIRCAVLLSGPEWGLEVGAEGAEGALLSGTELEERLGEAGFERHSRADLHSDQGAVAGAEQDVDPGRSDCRGLRVAERTW